MIAGRTNWYPWSIAGFGIGLRGVGARRFRLGDVAANSACREPRARRDQSFPLRPLHRDGRTKARVEAVASYVFARCSHGFGLGTVAPARKPCKSGRADARTRTGDPFITSEVL